MVDSYTYIGDPAFYDLPVEEMISDEFAAERAALIDMDNMQAMESVPLSDLPVTKLEPTAEESQHTTHIAVIDQYGNIVSTTNTLGMNVQQAINEPRAMAINRSGMDSPARVSIEQPRFDPDLVAQMEGIGYEMKDVGEYNMAVGGIAAIYLDRDNGIFYAGADPRRGYKALAY